jgi:pimeloyl-ACP methyl ester carboxylesterase
VSDPIRYVDANGLRFAYLEEGKGPLVLLLHGFPDTAHTWDHVRPRIAAKGYRAVSPFMRGYHPTGIPTRDADAETISRDALALIEALGEQRAILIGHDWGASAVYGATALEPDRVSKLFAVAIPHPATLEVTPAKLWGVRHFLAFKLPGAAARFAANDCASLPALYKRWSPAWSPGPEELADVRACFSKPESVNAAFGYYRQLKFRMPAWMRKPIAVDTVVFAGLNDNIVGPPDYYRAKRKFTKAYTVEEVPGGHFLHREHPEVFAERLLAHL